MTKKSRTRILLQSQVENAIRVTRSNRAAAQYLRVSYVLYKKFAKLYKNHEGIPLYDLHKNQSGRGVSKVHHNKLKHELDDILLGKHPSYSSAKLLRRLINNGYIAEKCNHCGYSQRRPTDLKVPILLHHINGDDNDHRRDNLEILCYNCWYVLVGNLPKRILNPTAKTYVTPEAKVVDPAIQHDPLSSTEEGMDILSDEEKMELIRKIQGL
jgi:hypothetical protein